MAEPRRFSEHTAQVIDEEVSRLLCDAAERATAILTEQREKLDLWPNGWRRPRPSTIVKSSD